MNWTLTRRRVVLGTVAAALSPGLALGQGRGVANNQEPTDMRIRMTFDGREMTAMLYDNPSARNFYTMLPLDLTIGDFGTNEKIAYLPRKLTEAGSGPFDNEQP
jgi:hypothetical protein